MYDFLEGFWPSYSLNPNLIGLDDQGLTGTDSFWKVGAISLSWLGMYFSSRGPAQHS
jgi:hypothetical protein